MAQSGTGPPIVGVKWGGESKLVGPEGPSGVWNPFGGYFLVILSHFGLFRAFFDPFLAIWVRGKGPKWVHTPYSWGKMGGESKLVGP